MESFLSFFSPSGQTWWSCCPHRQRTLNSLPSRLWCWCVYMCRSGAHALHPYSSPRHAAAHCTWKTWQKTKAQRRLRIWGAAGPRVPSALQRLPESYELIFPLPGRLLWLSVVGQEAIKSARERFRNGQMETHSWNEEEQE